jgi:hypothetical protein
MDVSSQHESLICFSLLSLPFIPFLFDLSLSSYWLFQLEFNSKETDKYPAQGTDALEAEALLRGHEQLLLTHELCHAMG